MPLHVALLVGYALLAGALYRTTASPLARAALVVFAVLNSAFLVVDGLVVGLRAPVDPASADALWATPAVMLLANATGAAWCAALLALAAAAPVALRIGSRSGYWG